MRGWILYKYPEDVLPPDAYEMHRFLTTGRGEGLDMQVVIQEQFDLIVNRDDRRSIRVGGKVLTLPDFLLPRRGAGTTYFCLAIIRHLEQLGVYVVNKSTSIETVKDKLFTQQILAKSELPFAKTMLMQFPVDADLVEKTLGFPVVVKTVYGAQGRGVFLAENRRQFLDLMSMVRALNASVTVILQEFIKSSYGRDLRVICIGGKAIACIQRSAADGGFKANVSGGGSAEAYELTPEIKQLSTEASRIFDLDVAGIDLLFDGDSFKICEVNSSPGFKGVESCHPELNVAAEIYEYVRHKLDKRERRSLTAAARQRRRNGR